MIHYSRSLSRSSDCQRRRPEPGAFEEQLESGNLRSEKLSQIGFERARLQPRRPEPHTSWSFSPSGPNLTRLVHDEIASEVLFFLSLKACFLVTECSPDKGTRFDRMK